MRSSSQTPPVIQAIDLCKDYEIEGTEIPVLKNINFSVGQGKFVVLHGPSGTGKTTLLNMIGGIDKATSGQMLVFGQDLGSQDEDQLSNFRSQKVGFVFQNYNLVSILTVAENVAFPMEWRREAPQDIGKRVQELLGKLGILHKANHFPAQLSGGEQQRVAFARALANDAPLLLADEPTGNLDTKNGQKIVDILKGVKAEEKTVIVSTHDEQIASLADQELCLEDGRLRRP